MHLWIVCASVDLSRAFVGGFDTVFTPYFSTCANHVSNGRNAQFAPHHSGESPRRMSIASLHAIDLTCKSLALNASFVSGVAEPDYTKCDMFLGQHLC